MSCWDLINILHKDETGKNLWWFSIIMISLNDDPAERSISPQSWLLVIYDWSWDMQTLYWVKLLHYNDIIMSAIASQITSLMIVYSTVCSDADQRKHQSSASLAFVRGIHWQPVNSPHKWPVTRKMFPFDDVIMNNYILCWHREPYGT